MTTELWHFKTRHRQETPAKHEGSSIIFEQQNGDEFFISVIANEGIVSKLLVLPFTMGIGGPGFLSSKSEFMGRGY